MIKFIKKNLHFPTFFIFIAGLVVFTLIGLKFIVQDGKFTNSFINEHTTYLKSFLGINQTNYNFKPQIAGISVTGEKYNIPKDYNVKLENQSEVSPFNPPQLTEIKSIFIPVISYQGVNGSDISPQSGNNYLAFNCENNCSLLKELLKEDIIYVYTARGVYYYEVVDTSYSTDRIINPTTYFNSSNNLVIFTKDEARYLKITAKLI